MSLVGNDVTVVACLVVVGGDRWLHVFTGTHGHMKCVFDSQLRSQDTPLLMLYKRMFPKWTYDENVLPCDLTEQADDVADAETMEELFDC